MAVTSSGEPLKGAWLFLEKQIQSLRGIPREGNSPLLALKTEWVMWLGMWLASMSLELSPAGDRKEMGTPVLQPRGTGLGQEHEGA